MKNRRILASLGLSILVLAAVLISPIGAPLVSAVQNIFMGLSTVRDITYGGKNVNRVVYRGQTIWERTPAGPSEPDPAHPTTYGAMQQMTNAQCSTTDGTTYDARNGQTYFVRKIGNLCWMETNLRYAGDGTWNAAWGYADDRYATSAQNDTLTTNDNIRPLSTTASGYLGGSQDAQYTMAGYFDAGGSTTLDTTTPTIPAKNATFYGYLYNWCAAMGGQAEACNSTSIIAFDTTQSICPAGWRLPTGGTGGEFQELNRLVNGNTTSNPIGLTDNFLAVFSGGYYDRLDVQDNTFAYWSSTVAWSFASYILAARRNSTVEPGDGPNSKYIGVAVRCVL